MEEFMEQKIAGENGKGSKIVEKIMEGNKEGLRMTFGNFEEIGSLESFNQFPAKNNC
jgi:hypothetical protein